ncbi:Fic family protein [Intrasporangium calvum]|uniref:Fic family protein n=1 Tax=Intrasporangium calvum TaxID=53358 RepID=A0ABT5GJL4_9MICO|nr:Fic family protein [Intrasporangium calvum]MDC5698404.1 Fic family protein [Intrasporangium calvum]
MPEPQPAHVDPHDALVDQLAALAGLPGVQEKADAVREACTRLRFHEALRRRIPEASAESRVRGARASAALEGADYPVDLVRELTTGARPWPDELSPDLATLKGAIAATAESERVAGIVRTAPLQALARLHVAAAAPLTPSDRADTLGRPRTEGEDCAEFVDVGPAPSAAEVSRRLAQLADLIVAASSATNRVPAVVISSIVHGEVIAIRPFVHGNGLVARALERALIQALGLDPTGVAVPEAGHVASGAVTYTGSSAAYGKGTAAGVGLWLGQVADGLLKGVAEGERICDAVRAGRLS